MTRRRQTGPVGRCVAYPLVKASGDPETDRENLTEAVSHMVSWSVGEVKIKLVQAYANGYVMGTAEIDAPPRRQSDDNQ